MCKAGKSENYSTTYGQESIMHGIWEGCMHGRTTRVYLIMGQWARMQWEVAMGKAMGKVPCARCHVQGGQTSAQHCSAPP